MEFATLSVQNVFLDFFALPGRIKFWLLIKNKMKSSIWNLNKASVILNVPQWQTCFSIYVSIREEILKLRTVETTIKVEYLNWFEGLLASLWPINILRNSPWVKILAKILLLWMFMEKCHQSFLIIHFCFEGLLSSLLSDHSYLPPFL